MAKALRAITAFLFIMSVYGHDMWLESSSYFSEPGVELTISAGNGFIFVQSENAVTPDRIVALKAVGPSGIAFEPGKLFVEGNWLRLAFRPDRPGGYWIGLATRPSSIRLSADDYRAYLEHDGLPDVLEERRRKGIADRAETEEYSKYVKTYVQVGEERSGNYNRPLGLTVEIVPQANPYELKKGDKLPVQVLFRGKPLPRLLLHAGTAGVEEAFEHVYTDQEGRAEIPITRAGKWYIRSIHLFEVEGRDHGYESYWASLTFEVAE